ncbi:hypothetical protein QBE52_03235 [Clostridiaceae bacterium 35-E11]
MDSQEMKDLFYRLFDTIEKLEIGMNEKLEGLEKRMNEKMDCLETRMNERFDQFGERLDRVEIDTKEIKESMKDLKINDKVLSESYGRHEMEIGLIKKRMLG